MSKRDPRTIERVMKAASEVEADTNREAAILGGIVRSLTDTGHLKITYVQHYAAEAVRYFAKDIALTRERPDDSRPTTAEVKRVARKFIERYDPGRGGAVPAAA
jgi:hypothetical protein